MVLLLSFGPFGQGVSTAAVIGVGTLREADAQFAGCGLQARLHGLEITGVSGKQVGQAAPFVGCFNMQGEGCPDRFELVLSPQAFDAHGTEVAPGSDEVVKNFQLGGLIKCHHNSPFCQYNRM